MRLESAVRIEDDTVTPKW